MKSGSQVKAHSKAHLKLMNQMSSSGLAFLLGLTMTLAQWAYSPPAMGLADNVDDISLTSQEELQSMVRSVFATIERNYGPLKLKKATLGLDWPLAKEKFFSELSEIKTERELVFRLAEFLFSFNDAHISILLPSSLTWTIPMQVSYAPDTNSYVLNYLDSASANMNLVEGCSP